MIEEEIARESGIEEPEGDLNADSIIFALERGLDNKQKLAEELRKAKKELGILKLNDEAIFNSFESIFLKTMKGEELSEQEKAVIEFAGLNYQVSLDDVFSKAPKECRKKKWLRDDKAKELHQNIIRTLEGEKDTKKKNIIIHVL